VVQKQSCKYVGMFSARDVEVPQATWQDNRCCNPVVET